MLHRRPLLLERLLWLNVDRRIGAGPAAVPTGGGGLWCAAAAAAAPGGGGGAPSRGGGGGVARGRPLELVLVGWSNPRPSATAGLHAAAAAAPVSPRA